MWTEFMDMHSGGGQKEKFSHCFIEAPEDEAKVVFYNRFGHNPERVTCTCCGDDYSIHEYETLEQATAYERNCEYDNKKRCWIEKQDDDRMRIRESCKTKEDDDWGLYVALDEYIQREDVMVILASEIKPSERTGTIPQQGYVWMD